MNTATRGPTMLSVNVERDEWIARYLAGKLSDSDTARFEAYWAEHPELIRDLEASARLKDGLGELRARDELHGVVRDRWWERRLSMLAVAATVSAFAAGFVAWQVADRVGSVRVAPSLASLSADASAPLAKGATYSLLRLRSSAPSDALLEVPAEPRAIELRVLPEGAAEDGRYRVRLIAVDDAGNAGPESVVDAVGADPDGFVTIYVDSRDLRAGQYRLQVAPAGAANDATTSEFRLSVRGPAGT